MNFGTPKATGTSEATADAALDSRSAVVGSAGKCQAEPTAPAGKCQAEPTAPAEEEVVPTDAPSVEVRSASPFNRSVFGQHKIALKGLFNNLTASVSLDSRNVLQVPCPDYIIIRMFNVISSWQKVAKELIHFSRWGLAGFLRRTWGEPYLMQLVEEIRIQACNDHRMYQDSPLIPKWGSPSTQLQQSVYQYVCWRLTVDGGIDVGRHTLPHNQVQKLYWYHLIKNNKLQVHLYSDVKNALSKMQKKS
jgi:hypothetical protein